MISSSGGSSSCSSSLATMGKVRVLDTEPFEFDDVIVEAEPGVDDVAAVLEELPRGLGDSCKCVYKSLF